MVKDGRGPLGGELNVAKRLIVWSRSSDESGSGALC